MLMEWAIGKGYDLYHPNTGKLLLPGSQISWDIHIHAVGQENSRQPRTGHMALSQRPGAQAPDVFDSVSSSQRKPPEPGGRYPAELNRRKSELHRAETSGDSRELP